MAFQALPGNSGARWESRVDWERVNAHHFDIWTFRRAVPAGRTKMNITDGQTDDKRLTRDCQRETGLVLNHLARHAEQNFWGDYYKEKRKSLDQVGNVCGRREKWAKEKGAYSLSWK